MPRSVLIVGLDQHDINVLWKVLRQSLGIAEWREDLLQHAAGLFYGGLFLLSCHSPLHLVEVRAFIKKKFVNSLDNAIQ